MISALIPWISTWLPRWGRRLRVLRLGSLERRLRRLYDDHAGIITSRLHGFPAKLNGGNPYPFFVADFPLFNRALVELVRAVADHRQGRIVVADVGASLGNTVLLLQATCAGRIAAIHSVEGDAAFYELLKDNTAQFPNVRVHRAMLARAERRIGELQHHHRGTAAATGIAQIDATTLDAILLGAAPHLDVLKIDIDGSDGEALLGAKQLLKRDQPAVIFEWHPFLIKAAGNDPRAHFEALRDAGYKNCLWFWNTGGFSHFSTIDTPDFERWHQWLLRMHPHNDAHFDIIALPAEMAGLEGRVAALGALAAGDTPPST